MITDITMQQAEIMRSGLPAGAWTGAPVPRSYPSGAACVSYNDGLPGRSRHPDPT